MQGWSQRKGLGRRSLSPQTDLADLYGDYSGRASAPLDQIIPKRRLAYARLGLLAARVHIKSTHWT